jgi:hypothetical protein
MLWHAKTNKQKRRWPGRILATKHEQKNGICHRSDARTNQAGRTGCGRLCGNRDGKSRNCGQKLTGALSDENWSRESTKILRKTGRTTRRRRSSEEDENRERELKQRIKIGQGDQDLTVAAETGNGGGEETQIWKKHKPSTK